MVHRMLSALVVLVTLAVLLSAPLPAQGQKGAKNTHMGKFVSATGNEFTMEAKGKEHTHVLAADGKVIGPTGADMKLADLQKGQMIRVTTKEGDMKTATKVEAVKGKKAQQE
jgi:hypothetical protein